VPVFSPPVRIQGLSVSVTARTGENKMADDNKRLTGDSGAPVRINQDARRHHA